MQKRVAVRSTERRHFTVGPRTLALIGERFWRYVQKGWGDECWVWTGPKNGTGYGVLTHGRRGRLGTYSAHRLSFVMHVDELSRDDYVLHSCDNRVCVNPRHLHIGSHQENADEAVARGRIRRGAEHGGAKLSSADVERIRAMYPRLFQREIAELFGVSQTLIGQILRGVAWRHSIPEQLQAVAS